MKSSCALPIAALVLFVGVAAAVAQSRANDVESARLDQAAASLKQIYATLQQQNLSAAELEKLQNEVQPLSGDVQSVLDELTPRLAALKTQLDQLGPAPGANAPPESAEIAAERAKRQKTYDDVDALVKRANLLAVQAQQADAEIVARRRARLEQSLFTRGPSLASPALWLDVISEAPRDVDSAGTAGAAWLGMLAGKLAGFKAFGFAAPMALILGLYWLSLRFARRLVYRASDTSGPDRLQKISAAWRACFVVAGLPIAALSAIGAIAEGFGLIDLTQSLPHAVFIAVVRVALVAGIVWGLLAPRRQNWRLLQLDDETCQRILRTALAFAILVSASQVAESLAAAIGASGTVQTMLRGLGVFLAALVLAAALWIKRVPEDRAEDVFGQRLGVSYDWYGLLRIILWVAVAAILTAVLAGLIDLGRFLADQVIWIGGAGAVTAMLMILIEEITRISLTPTTRFGRSLMLSSGLRHDSFQQLVILLSGAARVAIFVVAVLMVLAPWGVQSSDVSGYFYAAFFGFALAGVTVSLFRIVFALLIFIAGYFITRAVGRWLETAFLPHTNLDLGLRNAIATSFGYIGWILSLGFALAYIGVDFEKLAIVAGALSVGIGFGLQSIVNNFVSGLILLWERVIRVGDWICVGANEGFVRRINVRSTEIETFDCAAVVIPNSDLVAGIVKNFVRTDRTGRVKIAMAVNPAADPEKTRDVLLDIARGHKLVLKKPPPQVVFAEISASAFNFQLYCFIGDVSMLASVKSDLNFEIYRRFKEENLFAAPPPVLVVNLPEIEQHGVLLRNGDGAQKTAKGSS